MKRLAVILALFSALIQHALATFIFTNEFNAAENWTSYHFVDFSPGPSYPLGGCYFNTAIYLGNPSRTNHIDGTGASGSSWGGDITNNFEKIYAPLWASYRVDGYNLTMSTGNGGYGTSNTVATIGLLFTNAPVITFDGVAWTNQNIPTVNITHWFVGNATEDGAAASNRNLGSLGLNAALGTPTFDLFNELRTNFTDDVTNYYAGGHPVPGMSLIWGIFQALNMGIDTNVWDVTFNWGAGTASSNNIAVGSITVSGGTLTCDIKPLREAMAWDVPSGTITNDARSAFSIFPALGNRFRDIVQVTNLPAGNYKIYCNGVLADTCTDIQLAAGRNWFTNYATPYWSNRAECLGRDRDKMGANRTNLLAHSAGTDLGDMVNFGSFAAQQYVTFGKRGTNYIAAMQPHLDQVRTNFDVAIHDAAQMPTVTLTIVLQTPRYAPYRR